MLNEKSWEVSCDGIVCGYIDFFYKWYWKDTEHLKYDLKSMEEIVSFMKELEQ